MRSAQISLFAMVLASAGVPLYLHLPRYATADLGLSLTTLSLILIGLRCLDFLQDPLLGRVVDHWHNAKRALAFVALMGMAIGFVWLFALQSAPVSVVGFVAALVLLFTSYSLASILFYGQTADLAEAGNGDIASVATWREGGMLLGIILAAVGPIVLRDGFGAGYPAYGIVLATLAVIVAVVTRRMWRATTVNRDPFDWGALRSSGALGLIGLALVNSLPVAITSTLFLFFVEDWLQLPDLSGVLLVLFFLCAGLSVPIWTALARRIGARRAVLGAMVLSIVAFVGASQLSPGTAVGFAVICAVSGAALGADMVLLPALFSGVLERAQLQAGQAFGLWNFALKLSLALAAIALLPALDLAGFVPGQANSQSALGVLVMAYAIVPCVLKLIALLVAARLPKEVYAL